MFLARIHPLLTIGVLLGVLASVVPAHSQEPFYKGKTIRMIVGLAAGGGYDTYSRLIARHMSRYIPGNPTFVVENMDGAGSVIAANHIYKVAKPDGLTIGHILGGLFLQQLLGKSGLEFDGRKFEYIGVPAQDNFMIGVSKATGITSVDATLERSLGQTWGRRAVRLRLHARRPKAARSACTTHRGASTSASRSARKNCWAHHSHRQEHGRAHWMPCRTARRSKSHRLLWIPTLRWR